jgi:paraquat-inducible protein A
MNTMQASERHLALCETCGLVGDPAASCRRCGTRIEFRRADSIQRAWALLIAAYALYLPANLLPIMETRSLFGVQKDTIMSGVVYLWTSGSCVLALLVFVASVAVPLVKLISLSFLVVSVQLGWSAHPLPRAKLYRLLELIGRWSMLDVYVVTILVALVQVQSLAVITPGNGVLAFAAIVVLSLLATMSFDPRLIWDATADPSTAPIQEETREQP